ncbi:MAG: hypothetical protein N3A68_03740 [Bacteroidia bacterium]|jgi:hypothetical protein|nr:hypothetical protein [Bacteroidia bacterium]GIV24149.1 MAG: hypothetical protein KatS3mg025_1808 [Bacteroidia bacterium]
MESEKKSKKKRTLVVIDGDALRENKHYDFSFLEKEKRLEIWFFYRERIHHSFQLRRDFSAHNIVTPRYEEDLHLYLLKRVCFELGRRRERYRKILLIGGHHPIWEGLVQFLRERDFACTHILAEDYRVESSAATPPSLPTPKTTSDSSTSQPAKTSAPPERGPSRQTPVKSPAKTPSQTLATSKSPSKKGSSTQKTQNKSIYIYELIQKILKNQPENTSLTREDIKKMLMDAGIRIKKQVPSGSLTYFLEQLVKRGILRKQEDGTFLPVT